MIKVKRWQDIPQRLRGRFRREYQKRRVSVDPTASSGSSILIPFSVKAGRKVYVCIVQSRAETPQQAEAILFYEQAGSA